MSTLEIDPPVPTEEPTVEEAPVTEAPKEEPKKVWRLNVLDRCDRCSAQAWIVATLLSGAELFFCFHHSKTVKPLIEAQLTGWLDESERLVQKRTQGSEK